MNQPWLGLLLLALAVPAAASGQPAAMDLMQSMVKAMQNLSYQGRFVYRHDEQLESMLITHIKDADGERDSLLSLNGEAREIFRDPHSQTCVWPNSKKVEVDERQSQSFSPLWIADDIERLSRFYEFKILGDDRVAGHRSKHLQVMPKDGFRYGYEIWIHADNHLLLKSDMLDEKGRVIEQVMFTQLDVIPSHETASFALMPSLSNEYDWSRERSISAESGENVASWTVETSPAGFWRSSVVHQAQGEAQKHQLIFTDGLATVSVFIEPGSVDSLQGMSSMGAVHAYGVLQGGTSITAVGEVPLATVELLAKSVRP